MASYAVTIGTGTYRVFGTDDVLKANEMLFDHEPTAAELKAGGWIGPRKPRSLLAIRADLAGLPGLTQLAIWNALLAGNPPLWSTDAGANLAALAVLQLVGGSLAMPANDVLEGKLRAVAMYVQDNPAWLVNPPFAPTVNVPGDQPA